VTPRLRLAALRSARAGPFDLALGPGECAAVSGPSGAGKTLMLRLIADLDPGEGEAFLDGRPRAAFPAPAWRRRVAYAAAEPGWWAETAAAHFPDRAAAAALAAELGLAPALLEGSVARLSTGERQRLALVRVLLGAPAVLLLDEPTAALDPAAAARVEAVVRARLAAGVAVLLVTHDVALAARLSTRRFVLHAGRLAA
jgi:putative ABC transport system ATP-binding protein